mgnify:FL=1
MLISDGNVKMYLDGLWVDNCWCVEINKILSTSSQNAEAIAWSWNLFLTKIIENYESVPIKIMLFE